MLKTNVKTGLPQAGAYLSLAYLSLAYPGSL